MRRHILISIAACLYYSGLVALARWWTRRKGKCVIILNYHRADGGFLRRHLLYLRRHYQILPVEEALEWLYAKGEAHHKEDRRTPLVLTFDDGYRDNYMYGYALAKELHVPLTIYLVPGYIDSGAHFWWVEGKRLVKRAQVEKLLVEDQMYHLNAPAGRDALTHLIDTKVRYASSVAEREEVLRQMRAALTVPDMALEEELPALPITWEQGREMAESGLVSFGAHTIHHPILAYLTDQDELRREVEQCRIVLEQRLGHAVRSFAYPVGQMQHIGQNVKTAVIEAGYDWAVTTSYGFNTPSTDPHLLKRVEVDVDQHWLVMAAEAAGLWGFFSRLRWLPFVRRHLTNAM